MNYLFQFPDWVANRPLDYSRSALATLNKTNLNEPNGISQSTPSNLTNVYGPVGRGQGPAFIRAGVPVDWNFNGRSTDTGVNSDINGGLSCGIAGPGPTLNGFNDWNAIRYIIPQQMIAAQRFEVPKEENITDVIDTRLILLEGHQLIDANRHANSANIQQINSSDIIGLFNPSGLIIPDKTLLCKI